MKASTRSWTFGQRLGSGFATTLLFTVMIGLSAIYALRSVVAEKDSVINVDAESRLDAERLNEALALKVAAFRAFLLVPNDTWVERMLEARADFRARMQSLRAMNPDDEAIQLLTAVEIAESEHQILVDRMIVLRRSGTDLGEVAAKFEQDVVPKREAVLKAISALEQHKQRQLVANRQAASDSADAAVKLVVALVALSALLALGAAVVLTRALSRQIGSAVQHVHSSTAELQTAANQQASGSKEQATAMNEITTTISELLATSKQIADSAKRVAQIAEQTAQTARGGEQAVEHSGQSLVAIKQQVDLIVVHMLDLGKKSQQIGGILEIINELAEQTNILAINATIEAAGAGDSGRRFAVVADEIRKLADRVGGSTKQIRTLIEEIRAAVNTTVMTTEGGTKAVDAGTRQFADVAASFSHIVSSVGTTTEAAREIELSTKQQATAVEQVNTAISSVAQATRETESSASQTLQTAAELTKLASDLMRLIQPGAAA